MDNYLEHHGILGQKWGVRRYQNPNGSLTEAGRKRVAKLDRKNEKLANKSYNYEKKAANYYVKAEKAHSKRDLGKTNNLSKKAAGQEKKAAKYKIRSINEPNEYKQSVYDKKAAKLEYKASVNRMKANTISRLEGYSSYPMSLARKSDKFLAKAEKARLQMANNDYKSMKIYQIPKANVVSGEYYYKKLMEELS